MGDSTEKINEEISADPSDEGSVSAPESHEGTAQDPEFMSEVPPYADPPSWGDRMLVAKNELSPRHRKLAELAAQGLSNNEIAKALNYTASRVSILLSNSRINALVDQLREKIYQETVGKRLKEMAEPALSVIEKCLTDETNRFKDTTKVETAKWLLEKVDGKAVQKHDIGDNLLGLVMDRLDAIKHSGGAVPPPIDVTPRELMSPEEQKAKSEEDVLKDWVLDWDSQAR